MLLYMSKIMVIAGGDWQIELVKQAKKMGHYVICSNLYEDSPAFPYADACEVANVLDKQKNLEIAKKYMPDAIISDQSDIAVPTVAYLNEQLGLRGIGMEMANLFTDKSRQREFCKSHGIPVPDFKLCETPDEAYEMLEKYEKIIIKPIDSQSSRGVFTVETKEELDRKEFLRLTLSDNGNGYSEEVLERINEELTGSYDQFNVGINNLRRRLAILYRGECRTEFTNKPEGGACAVIHIPLSEKEPAEAVSEGADL